MIIIANPPYSLGNQITSTVLNNVDFKEYVNLMPVSKYNSKQLYQYIIPETLESAEWEGDADVLPYIASLQKKKGNKITEEDFRVLCCGPKFEKFFKENQRRTHYAISRFKGDYFPEKLPDPKTDFYIPKRTAQNGTHLPTGKGKDIIWNIHHKYIFDKTNPPRAKKSCGGDWIQFNTEKERENFTKWWYHNPKKDLMSKLLWSRSTQGGITLCLPKLDWTHEWTDEEILKDYGYTDEEIEELLPKPQIS